MALVLEIVARVGAKNKPTMGIINNNTYPIPFPIAIPLLLDTNALDCLIL